MEFAKRNDFHKPFSQIYFTEETSIHRFYDLNKNDKVLRQNIFAFEDYENRFNELLNQKYSWININFAGILENNLLLIIEFPNRENNTEIPAVNISLPEQKVIENNWNLSSFLEII